MPSILYVKIVDNTSIPIPITILINIFKGKLTAKNTVKLKSSANIGNNTLHKLSYDTFFKSKLYNFTSTKTSAIIFFLLPLLPIFFKAKKSKIETI